MELRVANWNIKWMNKWFVGDNEKPSFKNCHKIADLASRVAKVIKKMDADLINIQEGPSRKEEMELFVKDFLRDKYEVIGPGGKGQQKLYTLARNDTKALKCSVLNKEDMDFFNSCWDVAIKSNFRPEKYCFTRPPLVVRVKTVSDRELRLLNLHLKSKYVHEGEKMWKDECEREKFVKKAVKARRRISAEAMRVREYLNALFAADRKVNIVVTGDLNDGPGLDYFERSYLTHNIADQIGGSPNSPPPANAPPRLHRHHG